MSVTSNCIKTTADSSWNYSKCLFLNISDDEIVYNIFDDEFESVQSNSADSNSSNIYSCLNKLNKLNIKSKG